MVVFAALKLSLQNPAAARISQYHIIQELRLQTPWKK
jgi:hypothetical protein